MLNKIDINLLVSFATIIVLIMTLVCKDNFKSLELFYLVVIITLIIFMSSIKERFDEKFFSNYEIIPDRHPKKYIRNKNCVSRNKEHNDYKENIHQRLDKEREMEEQDRQNIVFKHEMEKLVDMGNENLEYIVNGENF
jgi:hypothetical protein